MTATEEYVEREVTLVPATDHSPQVRSLDVADFAEIVGREEEWRFTPLTRLNGLTDSSTKSTGELNVSVTNHEGVQFEILSDKNADRAGFTDRVAVIAWSNVNTIADLRISKNVEVNGPIHVTIQGTGEVAFQQIDVTAEAFSKATVILDYRGSATVSSNVDIDVQDGAHLTVVSLNDWDASAVHAGHHRISLGRDAYVKHVSVTLGGDLVRILPSVTYRQPGGSAELLGLYFASEGQHTEHRLFVDHAVPHCRSNVVYKGALSGKDAHTVWVGDVLIRANAIGTDTYEINRNLVLSDGGRADSVPNLEIETGEIVGAGHASTTGRFDDEQLFYLQSRGISAEEARQLVLRGFFEELLGQIGVPEINDRVRDRIESRIAGSAQ